MVAIYIQYFLDPLIAGMKCDLLSLVECDHYEDGSRGVKKGNWTATKLWPRVMGCFFNAQLEDDTIRLRIMVLELLKICSFK